MKRDRNGLRLSASDLMRFMACPHATRLDLAFLAGEGPQPADDSEDAILLQRYGDAHEAAHLAQLERAGKRIIKIEKDGISFDDAVKASLEALRDGPDIVFQGAFERGIWGGYSDFLERVDSPSELGGYSYEVADTKLKRKPAPAHVLQLVLYSDLLATVQGRSPERAHVVLGDGKRFSFRLAEYAAYARSARERLRSFVLESTKTRAVPCASCSLCRWREHCAGEWEQEDSLFRVAGITRAQVEKLEATGITTMATLAQQRGRVPKMAEATLEKLKTQAALQHERKSGEPTYALRPPRPGKGFDLLPRPHPRDLYYDIEGDPFYTETSAEGLEYLQGVWDGKAFKAFWAHDFAEEKEALVALFALFEQTITQNPQAHIYHYASYEITALRKLTTRHGVGEAQLDRWLRERRFIDLYAVVRGGVYTSEPSYSIKDMEAFYDLSRTGEVKTAGGSVVAYEKWRESRDAAILDEIEDYNRIDCVSTERLRDWLLGIRPDGRWLELGESNTEKSAEAEAELDDLVKCLDDSRLPEDRRRLLYDLGIFHWRERKPAAWAVFDAAAKDFEELCDDMECLGGLVAEGPQRPVKRSHERDYRYPPQETKLRAGKSSQFALEGGFGQVDITSLDRGARRVTLKMGPRSGGELPNCLDLLPPFARDAQPIPSAIRKVIEDQCGKRRKKAADDLLSRNPPRFKAASPLPLDETADSLRGTIAAIRAMDATVLPVQGPPGTGKTYVTARAILALVKDGHRVAVSSNSHEAIRNVLMACVDALRDDADVGLTLAEVELAHKIGSDTPEAPYGYEAITSVRNNDDSALETAQVVGGTAWLFSRDQLEGAFEYLFVDEAGQVSLANAVGMSNAAQNLVLVGDPRQLPQVVQGAHPYPANLSCLDWILGKGQNVAPDRGIFLPITRRMHPELCGFISSQFYEDRLHPHEATARQALIEPGLPSAGAWRIPVIHQGRAQECPEEIDAIRETIGLLLGGKWIDREGVAHALRKDDIIVVAPYNAQVNALVEALPDIRVGTVDKFQGQEAPVAIVSMTASSAEETSRGIEFLLSRERLNVALSRGKALSLVFFSPRLLQTACSTVEQIRLVNTLCALPDMQSQGRTDGIVL
ncbi:TM0106 family RecB-like putative nuclease [Mesorhizobium sp. CA15]|uniref:TM0106 family RecB-like putative nuclease n=1 Tax=Mesorhizobium sp. CA15 TaxID=2876641 RepID=UPI001CD14DE7|nr:TM0106 family RecB-like putative nuclease [Mesorhizobium sp. CA15]MBZ9867025.1 TM0106 family RecB-like putative nuclease [Mesorhizobium sp. CA15]